MSIKAPSKSPTNAPTNSPNGSVINGVVGVPIVPHASDTMTVTLPPSEANKLITMSQVSADNDDEVPVVGHCFEYLKSYSK